MQKASSNDDRLARIFKGIREAVAEMIEEKKKNNEQIAISVNGEVKVIYARDLNK